MKITAIKQQARLRGRYSVYLDNRYAFSLSTDVLLEVKAHVGQEINGTQVEALKKLSNDDKAYSLALAYAVRRMHSHWELADYLKRKGYDEQLSRQIMTKLEGHGLADDERFAEAWARNRRLLKSVSRRRLAQELRQKRVADDIIAQTLSEDLADEMVALRELIARRRKQTRYQDDHKLMQYLARQGFSYEDVKAALAEDA